jgi:hypothetical protein
MKKNMLTTAEIKVLKKKRTMLESQIGKTVPLMRGSISTNGVKHRQAYLSLHKDKKTHLIYLGEKRLEAAKRMSENYWRLLAIVEELTEINMALLKNDAWE